MRIKILKPIVVPGHEGVKPGEIIDCVPGLASYLVCDGNAEFVETVQTREPAIETRDPAIETQPVKRSKPRPAK